MKVSSRMYGLAKAEPSILAAMLAVHGKQQGMCGCCGRLLSPRRAELLSGRVLCPVCFKNHSYRARHERASADERVRAE
ncbi:hypothetical protein OKW38_004242 [Paraburkholderia sp. MM5496-R1]